MYFGNPNSNPYHNNNISPPPSSSDFINLSDYLVLDDEHQECWSQSTGTESSDNKAPSTTIDINVINQGLICDEIETSTNNNNNMMKRKSGEMKENTVDVSPRVTFRTRSQLEIMDDGFKWRKYGKKSVKNSPYPRNYYKCSGEGCGVKKRVERDREDSSYVLTSYEGVHNHESPCNSYCTPVSLVYSNEWPQQHPSATSSSN